MSRGGRRRDLSPELERRGRAAVRLTQDDFLLLTYGKFGVWTLPGGGVEPGETPEQAAVREA